MVTPSSDFLAPQIEAVLQKAITAVQLGASSWPLAFGQLPVAAYLTDSEGYVTYFNDACIPFAGRTPCVGEDRWCVTWKLYTEDGDILPHDQCPMAVTVRERRPVRGTRAFASRPDGTRVRFQPSPTPIFDRDHNFVGAVNALIDLSSIDSEQRRIKHGKAVANRLLAEMPMQQYAALFEHLESVSLKKGAILTVGNSPIQSAYFLESGLASAAWFGLPDRILDLALLGRDHLVGAPLLLGLRATPFQVAMIAPGRALRVDANRLLGMTEADPDLRTYLVRAAASQFVQIAQTATCNGVHQIKHRLPRWLLICHDQLDRQCIPLSHLCLSGMLGVRRAGISEAIRFLAAKGAVRMARGAITVLDRGILEEECCPCYAVSKKQTLAQMQRICNPA